MDDAPLGRGRAAVWLLWLLLVGEAAALSYKLGDASGRGQQQRRERRREGGGSARAASSAGGSASRGQAARSLRQLHADQVDMSDALAAARHFLKGAVAGLRGGGGGYDDPYLSRERFTQRRGGWDDGRGDDADGGGIGRWQWNQRLVDEAGAADGDKGAAGDEAGDEAGDVSAAEGVAELLGAAGGEALGQRYTGGSGRVSSARADDSLAGGGRVGYRAAHVGAAGRRAPPPSPPDAGLAAADALVQREQAQQPAPTGEAAGGGGGGGGGSASAPGVGALLARIMARRGPLQLDRRRAFPIERGICGAWMANYSALHADILAGRRPPRFAIMVSNQSGLADRLGATVSVFLYALLTGRAFQYRWQGQHELWHALRSDYIDWRYTAPEARSASVLNMSMYDRNWDFGSRRDKLAYLFWRTELPALGDGYEHVVWTSNRGATYRALFNPWLQGPLRLLGLRPATAFACIFDFLFRPSPAVLGMFEPQLRVLMEPGLAKVGVQVGAAWAAIPAAGRVPPLGVLLPGVLLGAAGRVPPLLGVLLLLLPLPLPPAVTMPPLQKKTKPCPPGARRRPRAEPGAQRQRAVLRALPPLLCLRGGAGGAAAAAWGAGGMVPGVGQQGAAAAGGGGVRRQGAGQPQGAAQRGAARQARGAVAVAALRLRTCTQARLGPVPTTPHPGLPAGGGRAHPGPAAAPRRRPHGGGGRAVAVQPGGPAHHQQGQQLWARGRHAGRLLAERVQPGLPSTVVQVLPAQRRRVIRQRHAGLDGHIIGPALELWDWPYSESVAEW
jgi:hypothetical protein